MTRTNRDYTKLLVASILVSAIIALIGSAIPIAFGEVVNRTTVTGDDYIAVNGFYICENGSMTNIYMQFFQATPYSTSETYVSIQQYDSEFNELMNISEWMNDAELEAFNPTLQNYITAYTEC